MRFQTLWEGRALFATLLVAALLAWKFAPALLFPTGLALLAGLAFFRDPERPVPPGPDTLVAPADGLITEVRPAEEPEMPGGAVRISIFLSVLDVHVNRAPLDCEVRRLRHEPGSFLDARAPESATQNERQTWTLLAGGRTILLRQITGAIARRIVAWGKEGDHFAKGDRIGMIRFGSRTDLFLPPDAEVLVKPGDRVQGGATVVARLPAGAAGGEPEPAP